MNAEADEIEIFPTSFRTSVYLNDHGDIVIKQEGSLLETEDNYVIVPKPHVEVLISALRAAYEAK